MGRFRGGKVRSRDKGITKEDVKKEKPRQHYDDIITRNEDFEYYYQKQAIIPEDEWDHFMAILGTPLPTTFRLTGHRPGTDELRTKLLSGSFFNDLCINQKSLNSMDDDLAVSDQTIMKDASHDDLIISDQYNHSKAANNYSMHQDKTSTNDSSCSTENLTKVDNKWDSLMRSMRPLPWYQPIGSAWHLDGGKKTLRTDEAYRALHKWLVAATDNGDISRQEAVSMIPPLFLDVKRDHLVLDMCAAPGSKTTQLVEQMYLDCMRDTDQNYKSPTGLVIANDSDQQRSFLLYHQVKRINSPNLMVTNHDGTNFPHIAVLSDSESSFSSENSSKSQVHSSAQLTLKFDRILADVPCSGDGTLRKSALMWRSWTPNSALGLHPLQIRLLDRAVHLLKVGGRLVYSTCSLNPIENEAVVAFVLTKYGSKLKIVDTSCELPGLLRRPGQKKWLVIAKDRTVYSSFSEVPETLRRRFPESLFPRPEYSELGLEHALCVYPHLQNTGGFFVCVIEKLGPIGSRDISKDTTQTLEYLADSDSTVSEVHREILDTPIDSTSVDNEMDAPNNLNAGGELIEPKTSSQNFEKKKKGFFASVDEGEFLTLNPESDPTLQAIFSWYGIDRERLINQTGLSFLVRTKRIPIRTICVVSKLSRSIFEAKVAPFEYKQDRCVEDDSTTVVDQRIKDVDSFKKENLNPRLEVINAGVRMFELYESPRSMQVPCLYRLLSESVHILLPFMTRRIIQISKDEMLLILDSQDSVNLSEEAMNKLEDGSAVAICGPVAIPVWVSAGGRRMKAFVATPNRPGIILSLSNAT